MFTLYEEFTAIANIAQVKQNQNYSNYKVSADLLMIIKKFFWKFIELRWLFADCIHSNNYQRTNRGNSFYLVNTIFLTVLVFPACNVRIYIPGCSCSGFHCMEWSPLIFIP